MQAARGVRFVPGIGGIPLSIAIEQREPGGVAWTTRTPGATSLSRSIVKPHFSP